MFPSQTPAAIIAWILRRDYDHEDVEAVLSRRADVLISVETLEEIEQALQEMARLRQAAVNRSVREILPQYEDDGLE